MPKVKVCVVDDDFAYTYLVRLIIREVDSTVDIMDFSDGDLVFEFISAHASDPDALPDIILLDINMPRMDGWAFLKAYREIAARVSKQIAIYVLSSSISDADLSKAKSDPLVTDYIVKPMEGERFIAMLKAFKAI